jgi:hypothetical protein
MGFYPGEACAANTCLFGLYGGKCFAPGMKWYNLASGYYSAGNSPLFAARGRLFHLGYDVDLAAIDRQALDKEIGAVSL